MAEDLQEVVGRCRKMVKEAKGAIPTDAMEQPLSISAVFGSWNPRAIKYRLVNDIRGHQQRLRR